MKKILLFICASLALSSLLIGQSIQFKNEPGTLSFDPYGFGEEAVIKVINTSDSAISVMAERIDNALGLGQESYFCWDVCYGPTTDRSIGGIRLAPGDSTTAFLLHFSPNGNPASGKVTMRFFVKGNETDFTDYDFLFQDISTDLEDQFDIHTALSAPFPNPANQKATIQYQLPFGTLNAELRLYNLIGREVQNVSLLIQNQETHLFLNETPAGLYFIYLIIDGKEVTSRKLVISH